MRRRSLSRRFCTSGWIDASEGIGVTIATEALVARGAATLSTGFSSRLRHRSLQREVDFCGPGRSGGRLEMVRGSRSTTVAPFIGLFEYVTRPLSSMCL
jgi:hypothetical protein